MTECCYSPWTGCKSIAGYSPALANTHLYSLVERRSLLKLGKKMFQVWDTEFVYSCLFSAVSVSEVNTPRLQAGEEEQWVCPKRSRPIRTPRDDQWVCVYQEHRPIRTCQILLFVVNWLSWTCCKLGNIKHTANKMPDSWCKLKRFERSINAHKWEYWIKITVSVVINGLFSLKGRVVYLK